uniref:Uncharacterized protein n=1 Tax=Nelumbo nucifera TaxID=4432 RepID=A0A822YUY2_NELNU|nr:TPA_asm: hypothetical protein HUJ06_005186 [Nelumbo nucifera]
MASMHGENANACYSAKTPDPQEERYVHQTAGIWSYVFQVIFQMNAGAVVLTDIVFWLILFPFLTMKDYKLTFLKIGMHSINAIILLGDMALNCLRFPLFRFAYFILWTGIYVIFQWLVHACISIWYLSVALMHFPCYGIFALLIRMKHFLMLRWFPQSYQCMM